MVVVSQLIAKVGSSGVEQTKAELKSMGQAASETSGGFKSMLGNALSFAAGQAVFNAVGNAVSFLKDQLVGSIQAAMNHQDVMDQTTKVIASTGDASGMTAAALENLADSLSQTTYYSNDAIESGENLLLTFTGIGKDVFPQATKTLLDMSKAMGGDTKGSAIELGKALNDPAQGLTALTRIGVTFTDSQKQAVQQMEAAGNMAGAQGIILKELQREFGGSSDATKTFGGEMTILQDDMGQAEQKIGTALIPILQSFAGYVSSQVMPIVNNFSDWFTTTAVPALQRFAGYLQNTAIPAIEGAASWISNMAHNSQVAVPVLTGLGAVVATMLVPAFASWAVEVAIATWPILAIMAAVGGLTAIFMALYNNNAGFKSFIDNVANGFKQAGQFIQANFVPAMQQLGTWMQANVLPVLQQIGSFVVSVFAPAWKQLTDLWNSQLLPLFKQMQPALQEMMPLLQLLGIVVGVVIVGAIGVLIGSLTGLAKGLSYFIEGIGTVVGGIVQLFTGVAQMIGGTVQLIVDILHGNWGKMQQDMLQIGQGMINIVSGIWSTIAGLFQAAWGLVSGILGGFVQGVIGFFQGLFDKLVGHSIVPDMINGIVSFFAGLPGKALAFVENLATGAINKFNDLKSQAINIFHDIVNGIGDALGRLGGLAGNAWSGVWSAIKGGINNIIGLIDGFIRGVDNIHVDLPGGNSVGFNIPQIPYLASGGLISRAGVAIVGERGPEPVFLPAGAQVFPNSQMSNFTGGSTQQQANNQPIYLQIDGRTFARLFMPSFVAEVRNNAAVRF